MSDHEGYVCGRAHTTPARQARCTRGSAPPRAGSPRCSTKSRGGTRGGTRAHQTQRARAAMPHSKWHCKVYASGRVWSGQSAPGAHGVLNGHSLRAQLRKRGSRLLSARASATVARAASWGVCGLYACMSNDAAECGWRGLRIGGAAWTDPWCCFQELSGCASGAQESQQPRKLHSHMSFRPNAYFVGGGYHWRISGPGLHHWYFRLSELCK
jgi:hypothetical protein